MASNNLIWSSYLKISPRRLFISIQFRALKWTTSRTGWSMCHSSILQQYINLLIWYGSSVDIPMSEGPVNLNWGPIMKHINENPFEFFQHDGWSFLGGATGVDVRLPSFLPGTETISVRRVIIPKNQDRNQNLRQTPRNL